MGSGIVATGKELGLGCGNPAVSVHRAFGLGDLGRVTGGTDDEKLIGADEGRFSGPTLLHCLFFRGGGVDHDQVHFFVFQEL